MDSFPEPPDVNKAQSTQLVLACLDLCGTSDLQNYKIFVWSHYIYAIRAAIEN